MSAPARPHWRSSGSGPALLCLHANASSSSQWRALAERLAASHRVLAADSWGAGQSPEWPSAHEIGLADEVALLGPVLDEAGPGLVLVGHSYGAAVALMAALQRTEAVRALVLYEPTLFAVVEARGGSPNAVDGIREAVRRSAAALDQGDEDAAARHFIDFWMGAGSWQATPPTRKPTIAAACRKVRRWAHALFTEPTPAGAFAQLRMPILYLMGEATPESAQAVARELLPQWPQAELRRLPGLGHMGPVTHADTVNAEIERFLRRLGP